MQRLKSAVLAILLATGSMTALPTSPFAQSCTCVGAGIRAEEPPPPLPNYDQPPIPAPGYIWTPGYWSWNNLDYFWVPGTWVEPPRPGLLWTPGYWGFSNGLYVFNRGYWGPHVGFYGGISYGFGYGGSGYQGGRWNNGVFFYNRSVNNVGNTTITNVYNEAVVPNGVTNTRASFNGGAGGTAARPTAEEEAAAREPHEKPTQLQIDHTRAASTNPASFASTNHGKPAVAATPLPGALTSPNVVKAKSEAAPTTLPVEPAPAVGKPTQGASKPQTAQPVEPAPAVGKPTQGASKPQTAQPVEPAPAVGKPAQGASKPQTAQPVAPAPAVGKPAQGASKPQAAHPVAPSPAVGKPAQGASKPQTAHPVEAAPAVGKPAQGGSKPQTAKPALENPKPAKPKCGEPGEPACR